MRRYSKRIIACAALLVPAFLILLNAQFSGLAVNRWTPSASLSTPRAGACSVLLADGRLLVAGGENGSSAVSSVEIYGTDGAFSFASPMSSARAGAACALLPDGGVLVAGGRDGGSALATAEVYDPVHNAWARAGSMSAARSGHNATVLPWGTVLVVGGEEGGLVEVFSPFTRSFTQAGRLSHPQRDYAVATLAEKKVMIAGGGVIEIYDAVTGALAPAASLLTPRTRFAAATLLDGTVLIAGGFDAEGRALATSEIFDPASRKVTAGPALSEARAGHRAYALPNNGRVLLVGGVNGEQVLSSTDSYSPRTGAFTRAAAMANPRQELALSPLRRGALMVAGGRSANSSLSGSEVYSFATIATDKLDYAPGETATFTGAGWKPGEQVLLQVSAMPADEHQTEFTAAATADGAGRFTLTGFRIDRSHISMKFLLRATGAESQADTTFTDAPVTVRLTATPWSPAGPQPYGVPVTLSGEVVDLTGAGRPTGTVTFIDNGAPVVTGAGAVSLTAAAAAGVSTFSLTLAPGAPNDAAFLTPGQHIIQVHYAGDGAYDPADLPSPYASYTISPAPTVTTPGGNVTTTYGTPATMTATVSVSGSEWTGSPAGTVTFAAGQSCILVATGLGESSCAISSDPTLPVGAHNYQPAFTPDSPAMYGASTAASNLTLTVNPLTTTTAISPLTGNSDFGQPVTFTATVTASASTASGPTGAVRFYDVNASSDLATVALSKTSGTVATASYTVRNLRPRARPFDPRRIRAYYQPDSTAFGSSDSSAADSEYVINQISPLFQVVVAPEPGVIRQDFFVTATGRTVEGATPSGQAYLLLNDLREGGPQPIVNGVVTFPAARIEKAGRIKVGVEYDGDVVFLAQAGADPGGNNVEHVTAAEPTTTTLTSAPATPANYGSPVTYTATVAPATATGTVAFTDNGAGIGCDAAPLAGGVATCTPSTLPAAGGHSLKAVYSGNTDFGTSEGTYGLTVTAETTTTTIVPSTTTPAPGATVTFNITVTGSPVTPQGSVVVREGSIDLCTILTLTDGQGSCAVTYNNSDPAHGPGPHSITASYTPPDSTKFAPSTSGAVVVTVTRLTATEAFTLTSPVFYGNGTDASVTISPSAGGPAVTGTITIYSGSTPVATGGVVSGGVATIPIPASALPSVGTHTLSMQYSGDANYDASATPYRQASVVVNQAATALTGVAVSGSQTYGQSLTFSTTLSITSGAGTPGGTITFYDGATQIGSPAAVTGVGQYSVATSALSATSHNVRAEYSGDDNFAAASATPASVNISKAATTTALTSNPSSTPAGQPATFTATVTSAGGGTPTGNVLFADNGLPIGAADLSGGTATFQTSTLSFGAHSNITATYSGDGNFASSVSAAYTHTVGKSAVDVVVTSNHNPADVAQQVTFTATLTPVTPSTARPGQGTLRFYVNGVQTGSDIVLPAAGGATGPIAQTLNWTPSAGGTYIIVARYDGSADPVYGTSVSAGLTQTVGRPNATVTLTSNRNPADSGTAVTFRAEVNPAPPATGSPNGTVTFFNGAVALSEVPLVAGAASYSTTLAIGTHQIMAAYNGDANFQPASSAVVSQVVSRTGAILNLTSSAPTAVASQVVTLTARVNGPSASATYAAATGEVQFFAGATLIGSSALVNSVAALNVANLGAGLHNLKAVYAGDANWTSATSNIVAQTITQASTTTQLALTTTPVVYGQPAVFRVTVAIPTPGTFPATGTVRLYENGNAIGDPSSAAGGTVNISISTLTPGEHIITARFTGDANYQDSQSSPLTVTVFAGPTATTLAAMPDRANAGKTLLVAVVTALPPASGIPTGTVQFRDVTNGTILGTAPVLNLGGLAVATLSVNSLEASSAPRTITASYPGDGSFAPSTSAEYVWRPFVNIVGVTNAAGYQTTHFAPEQIANAWGENLAASPLAATALPLPTTLGGVTIRVRDSAGVERLAPLFYVSGRQINFQIPAETAYGFATLTVTASDGTIWTATILITPTAPGVFTANATGNGPAAAQAVLVHSDGSQTFISNLARWDDASQKFVAAPVSMGTATDKLSLILYGTGLRGRSSLAAVAAVINGQTLPVQYAGIQPSNVGLDQINIELPRSFAGAGALNITVTVDGESSNTVTVVIQ